MSRYNPYSPVFYRLLITWDLRDTIECPYSISRTTLPCLTFPLRSSEHPLILVPLPVLIRVESPGAKVRTVTITPLMEEFYQNQLLVKGQE